VRLADAVDELLGVVFLLVLGELLFVKGAELGDDLEDQFHESFLTRQDCFGFVAIWFELQDDVHRSPLFGSDLVRAATGLTQDGDFHLLDHLLEVRTLNTNEGTKVLWLDRNGLRYRDGPSPIAGLSILHLGNEILVLK